MCAAPGFSQFLVIDSPPVLKGLVSALKVLVRVSQASRPVLSAFVLCSCPQVGAGLRLSPFMCLCASRSLTGVALKMMEIQTYIHAFIIRKLQNYYILFLSHLWS